MKTSNPMKNRTCRVGWTMTVLALTADLRRVAHKLVEKCSHLGAFAELPVLAEQAC